MAIPIVTWAIRKDGSEYPGSFSTNYFSCMKRMLWIGPKYAVWSSRVNVMLFYSKSDAELFANRNFPSIETSVFPIYDDK